MLSGRHKCKRDSHYPSSRHHIQRNRQIHRNSKNSAESIPFEKKIKKLNEVFDYGDEVDPEPKEPKVEEIKEENKEESKEEKKE